MTVAQGQRRAKVKWNSVDRNEEQTALRQVVADIASDFGHGYYTSQARAGGSASELWNALGKGGFLGINLPEAYGGGGAGITELAIVEEELSAAGCPLLMMVVSPAICGSLLARYGTDEQKQNWLPAMAAGEAMMSFAITEPDAGSNSHEVSTVATPTSTGWRLRGTKHYISGVDTARGVVVVARTRGADGTLDRGLSLFIVETDRPGLERTLIETEMVSPERQFTLFFDDVELPETALIGVQGEGLAQVFDGLNPERIMAAAVGTGLGRYSIERGAAYAQEREVWGVPIGAHQAVAHPLARAMIQLEAVRLMNAQAANQYDAGHEVGPLANMAKFLAAEAAPACLDAAIQVHGGHGLSREYGLADLWGMTRLYRIAPVSQEMVLNYMAQHQLGLPKSY